MGIGGAFPEAPLPPFPRASLLKPTQADVLDDEVLVDAVVGSFAPEAGLLHAPERRHLGRDNPRVESDDTKLKALGHSQRAVDIARVEVGGQAVFGPVG